MKDLWSENFETVEKKNLLWHEQINNAEMTILPNIIYGFNSIIHKNWKNSLKFQMNANVLIINPWDWRARID